MRAVDGVSFRVEPGEFVGYLGPNGAGKSTTIKMLTGILTPSSGTVRVCGPDPSRQRTAPARRLGVVFGQRTTLWWDLPLRGSLTLVRHLHRVEAAAFRARLAELSALPGVAAVRVDGPRQWLRLPREANAAAVVAAVAERYEVVTSRCGRPTSRSRRPGSTAGPATTAPPAGRGPGRPGSQYGGASSGRLDQRRGAQVGASRAKPTIAYRPEPSRVRSPASSSPAGGTRLGRSRALPGSRRK